MAKKAKTPRPPQTVQAPRKRGGPPAGSRGSGPERKWLLVAAAVIGAGILAAGAVALTSGRGGGGEGVRAAMEAAGCTIRDVEPLPPKDKVNYHADVPTLESKVEWSTDPPSAGGHYGLWAIWNFYREPVNPRLVTHNLEHGGVAMWWGPKVPPATVDQLEAFYRASPVAMIGTPLATLGNKIVLTVWTGDPARYYENGHYGTGHIATCTKFDQEAFETFRDEYRGDGPEGVPMSSSPPGSGPG